MTKPVVARGVAIGEGAPKIIVSLMAKTPGDLVRERALYQAADFDMLEWRVDYFVDLGRQSVLEALRALREGFPGKPILFTFRSRSEGGECELAPAERYAAFVTGAAESGFVDLIDVELFTAGDLVGDIVSAAHAKGVGVVMSSHDFQKTPPKEEMLRRLRTMRELGADIPKLAVMPRTRRDVLNLLDVTLEMAETSDCPIITMAMGKEGVVSRLSGEVFGSAATFGSVQRASAPGQVATGELRKILEILHRA